VVPDGQDRISANVETQQTHLFGNGIMPSVQIGQLIVGPRNETYTISDFLGSGAFGEVYRAIEQKTGSVIAVKLLPFAGIGDEHAGKALLNEIGAAGQIAHPNVVRVLHVDEGTIDSIGPYVCMEYVSGGTLATQLRRRKEAASEFPLARAVEMMMDISQGLRAINERLVHRDVKPDNILIEDQTLKIGDFGISKFVDESTRSNTFKGRQHIRYMAPEAWIGGKNTHKIDVYAVGIVFFEILTLEHPLLSKVKDRNNFLDWQRVHLYEPCPDLRSYRPDTPIALVQLISRMIAKRPQERPEWDETLRILSSPATAPDVGQNENISQAVRAAVASAILRKQEKEKRDLEVALKREESERFQGLYRRSCEELVESFDHPIAEFNQSYQFGKIAVTKNDGAFGNLSADYNLPTGKRIAVKFFDPNQNGQLLRRRTLIGGGYIGITRDRSANLVLLRDSEDDLYGRWSVCEVKVTAIVDPRKVVGKYGLTRDTVEPFGFSGQIDFYDQIFYAGRGMHIFTYTFTDNVQEYFSALIAEACK
jgi:eukaryotic-like serine/threonine-protein kinase